ncbi:MAG: hypothetical protein CFE45_11545 [Burkholderiales bacterium PBB5]|nr:MAG: hypothetical protein CFE45_11545 [Burkholderiales bacterium PBB5]
MRDTGIGIAPERVRQLFSAFEQADTSTTRRFGGTGLGLAITRHLAELMGGEVGVDSRVGEGSVFWFTARLQPASATPMPLRPTRLAGVRVLLVDDRPEPRQAIASLLRLMGLRPEAVATAAQALVTARSADELGAPFALALIDQSLTDSRGLDLVRQLGALGLTHPPRCVLMVLQVTEALRREAADAGVLHVVEKPVHNPLLQSLLGPLLDQRALPPPAADSTLAERMLRSRFPGARVLLAEDNPVNQMVAVELLRAAGLEVDVADDGPSAVDLASRRRYDLILLDVQMPELDGLQACRRIRALPDCAQLPILAMTANAFSEDRAACLDAGMDDHVPKPVEPQRLYEALLHWLSARTPPAPPALANALATAAMNDALRPLTTVGGLDVATGLRHFGGRGPSYLRGLQRFVLVYGQGLTGVGGTTHTASGARDGLLRQLHSLRGAAGTVGAAAVQAEAAHVEMLLHAGRPDAALDQALAELDRMLGDLVQQLRAAIPADVAVV